MISKEELKRYINSPTLTDKELDKIPINQAMAAALAISLSIMVYNNKKENFTEHSDLWESLVDKLNENYTVIKRNLLKRSLNLN